MKIVAMVEWATGALLSLCISAAAVAQGAWTPASEIVNQPVQVTTNDVTDILLLTPDGQATIRSPNGSTTVNAAWGAANNQLCLSAAGRHECIPYARPFVAGEPLTLTSSCGATETWLAITTNSPPAPPAPRPLSPEAAGERGR